MKSHIVCRCVMPEPATASWDVNISEADFLKLKARFEPQDQDDKWRVWHTEERHNGNVLIYCARAGTGNELYIVPVKSKNGDCNTGALPEYDLNNIWDHGAAALPVDEQG